MTTPSNVAIGSCCKIAIARFDLKKGEQTAQADDIRLLTPFASQAIIGCPV
jgi:hypothetical protein